MDLFELARILAAVVARRRQPNEGGLEVHEENDGSVCEKSCKKSSSALACDVAGTTHPRVPKWHQRPCSPSTTLDNAGRVCPATKRPRTELCSPPAGVPSQPKVLGDCKDVEVRKMSLRSTSSSTIVFAVGSSHESADANVDCDVEWEAETIRIAVALHAQLADLISREFPDEPSVTPIG
eukprot:scaffold49883_cov29-Tisochrysis_lutea.AAC.5